MNGILVYLLIGVIWAILHEPLPTNGVRFRFIVLWPFTFIAWVMGFINAIIDSFRNDEEM